MGHLLFFLAVVAACLLWSAAFTAAAARSRPGCRFDRDWSRPGIDVLLPEVQEMRTAARRLALAARRAAVDGEAAAALAPTLTAVLNSWSKGMAVHEAAGVLVAATQGRLEGRPLADSLGPDAPLPPDPFTRDRPLVARSVDGGWLVYSVGHDGEDDGGPAAPGAKPEEGNDDVGLRLEAAEPAAPS